MPERDLADIFLTAELLDVLHDTGLAPPPFADRSDEFNPYAIEMRYGLVEPEGLDRPGTETMISTVLDWAMERLFPIR